MTDRGQNRNTTATVMIVDDEDIVTRAIAGFLELETDYRVLTFQSPQEALAATKRERIDCVVTDFLMPGMNGLEFLQAMRQWAPDVPAILLTGYADKENAIRAINEINLFQYLEKPWDNDRLGMVIRNAINHRSLEQALSEKLRELDRALRDRADLQHTTEIFEQELALAEEVQQAILPRSLTGAGDFRFFHRYFPTGRLGGDYFDVLHTAPGVFNAIVADVAGHGVPASLGTMLVKVIFYEASERGECCDGMLAQMNRRLVEFLPQQQYVTAFALSVNGPRQTVTAAAAGGPHPIIFRAEGAEPVTEWRLNGLPLGAFPEEFYRAPEPQTRPLVPGDRILLYTDGLLDVNIDRGEFCSPDELVRLVASLRHLPGDEFLDRLIDLRGVHRANLPDDVNVLLIEYC